MATTPPAAGEYVIAWQLRGGIVGDCLRVSPAATNNAMPNSWIVGLIIGIWM
jgi:hypothetical protein